MKWQATINAKALPPAMLKGETNMKFHKTGRREQPPAESLPADVVRDLLALQRVHGAPALRQVIDELMTRMAEELNP